MTCLKKHPSIALLSQNHNESNDFMENDLGIVSLLPFYDAMNCSWEKLSVVSQSSRNFLSHNATGLSVSLPAFFTSTLRQHAEMAGALIGTTPTNDPFVVLVQSSPPPNPSPPSAQSVATTNHTTVLETLARISMN